MIQAVMTQPGEIEFREVSKPKVDNGRVLVKIMRIGICGSDIHVYHGKHPYTSYPVVQGHEVSGEVVEVGDGVSNLKAGDKVTIRPQVVCGECYQCKNGQSHICDNLKVMGFQTTGTASQYFLVNEEHIIKLPDSISYNHGAMIEPMAVAIHALRRAGSVEGKNILVLGAGPIGNLIAQSAKGMGANKVMITDISDYRLEVSKSCGIDYCINTSKENLTQAINDKFGADKADLILECVGIYPTMKDAITNARKGTDIIVVGVFGDDVAVDMGLVQDRELRLIGTLMYQEKDYIKAIELVEKKLMHLNELITAEYKFTEYLEAYHFIEKQKDKSMKIMIKIDEQ